jgi:hypothetical protein
MIMKIQERITAARRELRAALRAKKAAQMTGSGIVKSDDSYEYPEVAEAIKDTVKLSIDFHDRFYLLSEGSEHSFNGDMRTTWVELPKILVNKYNVATYMLREMQVHIEYDTTNIEDCARALQEIRRTLYKTCVYVIKGTNLKARIDTINNMPF